ncbi:sulfite exporter TauE/SafE family protein [Allofrancisella guangzhouensis]|uniref:Probable membrane transporter protein n=1 Tax=Allofrancisella guangzhouensis TaxID=594679 RepID=A0A0A8E4Z3_9GAMM|nr:sulfite exporter TauE/SafE family protein [Allofrancisella guangzhouensis]AJC49024.1 membrane protein [Allofrancisella guangzhouensis]MBK2027546.1 sulfite exporter TauE/SafE family protein [Allofrancisella guangzhouensis]MBK2044871.1 sulfite exporter TauE/SafE family protein [Allofrancisella guangzhouensis]MBK2046084.1 sulfite exporter TauE/SafE family protein [Allofrancisella guangzhouensis]
MENNLLFELIIFLVAIFGGTIGSIVGLGGALVITPLLSTVLSVPLHYTIGASLVAIICTSSATSLVSLKSHGLTKEKLGIFLALAAGTGGILGAKLAISLKSATLFLIFGGVLVLVALLSFSKRQIYQKQVFSKLSERLQLNDNIVIDNQEIHYNVDKPGLGFLSMLGAGFIGGLLGIGAGAFKVIAMDKIMKIPFKVSASTSNFIMGITAFAATSTYYFAGYIDSIITLPVALGTLLGATIGSKIMPFVSVKTLRIIFFIIILIAAIQMIGKGLFL